MSDLLLAYSYVIEALKDDLPMKTITRLEMFEIYCNNMHMADVIEIFNPKQVDKFGKYRILSIDIGDRQVRHYLEMLNPSTKEYHYEGVPPEVTTVEKALKFRNQSDDLPEMLT